MRYVSVCAGIEAATVAWHHLGWEPAWFSEIEPFPSAVLAHHYPKVKNLGDMTRFETWPDATVELICAGTPCQSFSVAGLRQGLADPRGNLMLTFLAIAQRYRPRWIVWENVPGVLSSNGGRDFGTFLGALGELGYGWAYRVLDAQWFGVAQRRRRVFVVGCLGDWQRAAQVLFERESVRRDSAPSREKGQEVAGTFKARANSGGWCQDVDLAAGGHMRPMAARMASFWDGSDVAATLTKQNANGAQRMPDKENFGAVLQAVAFDECANRVTHSLRGEGFDASEDGTGRSTPVVPITFGAQMSAPQTDVDMVQTLQAKNPMAVMQPLAGTLGNRGLRSHTELDGHGAYIPVAQPVAFSNVGATLKGGSGERGYPDPSDGNGHNLVAQPIPIDTMNHLGRGDDHSFGDFQPGGPSYTLTKGHSHAVAQPVAPSLTASNDPSRSPQSSEVTQQVTAVHNAIMQVRRLTPVECERLQGFPDGYTNIPWRKKAESPDGPRYKALGNSMAVPVMRWIGERIAKVDA